MYVVVELYLPKMSKISLVFRFYVWTVMSYEEILLSQPRNVVFPQINRTRTVLLEHQLSYWQRRKLSSGERWLADSRYLLTSVLSTGEEIRTTTQQAAGSATWHCGGNIQEMIRRTGSQLFNNFKSHILNQSVLLWLTGMLSRSKIILMSRDVHVILRFQFRGLFFSQS